MSSRRRAPRGLARPLLAALLVACGGQRDEPSSDADLAGEPQPGADVVHTPPPNADSLHRVRARLYFRAELVGTFSPAPLGGWDIEALGIDPSSVAAPITDPCNVHAGGPAPLPCFAEAVTPTDVEGVAIFWLERPGPYRLSSSLRAVPTDPSCGWQGSALWDGSTADIGIELSVVCE